MNKTYVKYQSFFEDLERKMRASDVQRRRVLKSNDLERVPINHNMFALQFLEHEDENDRVMAYLQHSILVWERFTAFAEQEITDPYMCYISARKEEDNQLFLKCSPKTGPAAKLESRA